MAQVPIDLTASIPCSAVQALPPQGGMLLATAPPQGDRAALEAMFVRVAEPPVDVVNRNAVVASAERARIGECSSIDITSDNEATTAAFTGLMWDIEQPVEGAAGQTEIVQVPAEGRMAGDFRPQVVGVFSDLEGAVPAGLSFDMTVDTRFSSSP